MPVGRFVGWLSIPETGFLVAKSFCRPGLESAPTHRDVNSVRLTKQQVKDSPDIDADEPVSRQMEIGVYDYYGWCPYWESGLYMGGYGYAGSSLAAHRTSNGRTAAGIPAARKEHLLTDHGDDGDPHLRSIGQVLGYHIHASDGEIGHVNDFLLG